VVASRVGGPGPAPGPHRADRPAPHLVAVVPLGERVARYEVHRPAGVVAAAGRVADPALGGRVVAAPELQLLAGGEVAARGVDAQVLGHVADLGGVPVDPPALVGAAIAVLDIDRAPPPGAVHAQAEPAVV